MKSEEQLRTELEGLNAEVLRLNEVRVRIEERVSQAQKESDQLSAEFLREFGTSDIEELKLLLQQRAQENERIVEEFSRTVSEYRNSIEQAQNILDKLY